jgi:hypothetical protein
MRHICNILKKGGKHPKRLLGAGFVMHFLSTNIEHNAKRFYTSSLCNFVFPVLFSQVYIHFLFFILHIHIVMTLIQ